MRLGGPAAGDARLMTSADPTGRRVLGTINNCAMGYTPWGTYLACEENFNGYFRKLGTPTPLEQRYGINASGAGYLWHTTDLRFLADGEPNEANRFGWVVEIDPFDPELDSGQAHGARPAEARGCVGSGSARRPRRRLHR